MRVRPTVWIACGASILWAVAALAQPSVAGDEHGHVLAAWGTGYVEVVGSRDGLAWTAPGGPAGSQGSQPRIAGDGAGTWMLVWSRSTPAGSTEVAVSRSTDDGATWADPTGLGGTTAPAFTAAPNVDVATDRHGTWLVVWDLEGAVFAASSHDRGATWTGAVRLDANAATERRPRVATDGGGVWVVVWESATLQGPSQVAKSDVLAVRSIDDGRSWTAPALLSTGGAPASVLYAPHVAANASGDWLAVWHELGRAGFQAARSTDGGIGWSPPTIVGDTVLPPDAWHGAPSVAADGDGWVVVWPAAPPSMSPESYAIEKHSRLLLARSLDGVVWTAGSTDRYGQIAAVASAATAGLVLVLQATRFRLVQIFPHLVDTYPDGFDVQAARSVDGGTTWSPTVGLNVNRGDTCQKQPDCDDGDACTVDECAPALEPRMEFACVSTEIGDRCIDGDLCTRDACHDDACSNPPREGFVVPRCAFRPDALSACADVSVARSLGRRVGAARRLARRANAARRRGKHGKATKLSTRAARLLRRVIERPVRGGTPESRIGCAAALGLTLGDALREVGVTVFAAENTAGAPLPGTMLALEVPPGDYLLFASCRIRNSRTFDDTAWCSLGGVSSPSIPVPSSEVRTVSLVGFTRVDAPTSLFMECDQANIFQFSSLVDAERCIAMAVARR